MKKYKVTDIFNRKQHCAAQPGKALLQCDYRQRMSDTKFVLLVAAQSRTEQVTDSFG